MQKEAFIAAGIMRTGKERSVYAYLKREPLKPDNQEIKKNGW